MKKTICVLAILSVMTGLGLVGAAFGNGGVKDDGYGMMVSPQCIVLSKVDSITVHTNIPLDDDDVTSVTIDGVEASMVWNDDCGHLAARFAVADLGLQASKDPVELTMIVSPVAGSDIEVSDEVRVKD